MENINIPPQNPCLKKDIYIYKTKQIIIIIKILHRLGVGPGSVTERVEKEKKKKVGEKMASFASSATTGGARKQAWTNYLLWPFWTKNVNFQRANFNILFINIG